MRLYFLYKGVTIDDLMIFGYKLFDNFSGNIRALNASSTTHWKGYIEPLYARYLCSRAHSAARPSARATIGYLVYKLSPYE